MRRVLLLITTMIHSVNTQICGTYPNNGCCAGYYINPVPAQAALCVPCPIGRYCPCTTYYCTLYTPSQCTSGFINVTRANSSAACIPWQTCPANTYISTQATASSDRVCSPCKTSCPAGKYLAGATCTGLTLEDTRVCTNCSYTCPTGHYLNFQCSGNTTQSNMCQLCTVGNCASGTYRTACNVTADGVCAPCTQCPAGQYNSACNSTYTGRCSPCTVCSPGHDAVRACGAFTDTICTNAVCDASTSCAPLFCNYPVIPVTNCPVKWKDSNTANGSFICIQSNTSGSCQPCPPGWTATGAYCVPCDNRYSCDTLGQEVCVGACAAGYSPVCDPFIGQTTCSPCSLNSTLLTAKHMTITRGGILEHPELCDAYATCTAGYYTSTANNANVCLKCVSPDYFAVAGTYVFITNGLTDQDPFSCLYAPYVPATSTNIMGTYGVYRQQCPPGYTSQANMAAYQANCTQCVYTPLNGYGIYGSTDCSIACNEGYTLLGQECVNALTVACLSSPGYTLSTSTGECLSMQLPWNNAGNAFSSTYTVLDYPTGTSIISLDASTMLAATATELYITNTNLNFPNPGVCGPAQRLPGSVSDEPLTALKCYQLEYHRFYLVHQGLQFGYVFLQRSFGSNNRYVLWKVYLQTGYVVGKWRLPGMVCDVASEAIDNFEYLYISFCNTTFVSYVNASVASFPACNAGDRLCTDAVATQIIYQDPSPKVAFLGGESKLGFAVGLLAGAYLSGAADGLRDTARFKGPLSLATSAIMPKRVFVADYSSCRLAEIAVDYPGSWLTSTRTIIQSCYANTGAIPFPTLLTAVLNGAMLLFLTDQGLMQMDTQMRQFNLILPLADLPDNIRWLGASKETVYIWTGGKVTLLQRTPVPCPEHQVSQAGGACTPCAPAQYASTDRCLQCSVQQTPCSPGYIWQACGNNTNAGCVPCAHEGLPGSNFNFSVGCNTILVPPCPVAYYADNGVCAQCPPWSTTASSGALAVSKCACMYGGAMNATTMTCVIPSPYTTTYSHAANPQQSWTADLGCANLQGDTCSECSANGLYLAHVVPRLCIPCPSNTVGLNGLWCETCPSQKVPSPLQDICTCAKGATMMKDTSCVCSAGYFTDDTGCTRCPANTFNAFTQANSLCLPCPLGTSSLAGASACQNCAPGTFRDQTMFQCGNCSVHTHYARDPTSADSCTPCMTTCAPGMMAEPCPRASSLFKCSACPHALGPAQVWLQDQYNTNCLWECQAGFYMSNNTCLTCTAQQCPPGVVLTPCSKYQDSACMVSCVNSTMPFVNAEWDQGCAWKCKEGFQLITKTFMNWVEYMCYTQEEVVYNNRFTLQI